MVLIHIVSKDEQQATEIADYLVSEKLVLNALMMDKVTVRKLGERGELVNEQRILIMGKTKGLLFNTIDERLREKYPNNMPVLYSLAIVNMDWEQADELANETVKV